MICMLSLVVVYNFAPRTYAKRQHVYMESFVITIFFFFFFLFFVFCFFFLFVVITMMPTVTGFISGYFNL